MERIEILINRVRQDTNLTDRNGVNDSTVLGHFNDAQKTIQSIIYQACLEPDFLVGTTTVTMNGEQAVDLPEGIYSPAKVLYCMPTGKTKKLDKIQSFERGYRRGYFIENNQIGFSDCLLSQYNEFNLKYFIELPVFDIRRGLITAKGAKTLTVSGHSTSVLIGSLSDWATVVDLDGTIIQSDLRILSFDSGTGIITFREDILDAVDEDHYVVMGKLASTHSLLPDSCEPFLLDFVKKKIRSKNNSKETSDQALFSEEQKELLMGLFAGNGSDMLYPPMTDRDFL